MLRPSPSYSLAFLLIAGTGVHAESSVPAFLEVTLNGENKGATAFLRQGDALFISLDDLRRWRLAVPSVPTVGRDGKEFVPASAIKELKVQIDERTQTVALTAPPDVFVKNTIQIERRKTVPLSPQTFSAYLNYEADAQIIRGSVSGNGMAEAGVADTWGALTNSAIFRSTVQAGISQAVRLDTRYVYDMPVSMTRLVAGDSVTRATPWTRPFRFAGLQFGTDFGLQPDFINFPTPSFLGQATLPSTVDAYVNDAVRFSSDVPQGPFDVHQIPVVAGAGDIRFVVKDALGIERTIRSSYYVSPNLLQAGLDDYSAELGFLRNNFGVESFSYQQFFGMGTYRRGLTDRLTAQLHVEAAGNVQQAGTGLTYVVLALGELSGAVAVSREKDRSGFLGRGSYTYLGRLFSVSLSYQAATPDFTQIGANRLSERIRRQAQAFASLSLGEYGHISASYTQLATADSADTRITSLNYDVPLFDTAYLNVYGLASESRAAGTSYSWGVQLTLPLGERRSASVSTTATDGRLDPRAEYRNDPPFGSGVGYRLSVSPQEENQADGEITWQNSASALTGDAAYTKHGLAGRVIASGSFAYAGGKSFAARQLGDAFGTASVSQYEGVRVYQENQLVGRTDADGQVALPNLRPYQENRISIETADLPLNAEIEKDAQILVPAYHGAAVAGFAASSRQSAVIVLHGPGGTEIPPGVSVSIDGRPDSAFTGYGGEVFIRDAHTGAVLEASWDNKRCRAILPAVPANAPQPRLGSVLCEALP